MNQEKSADIELGKCIKPHGIKGGVLFYSFSPKTTLQKNQKISIFPLSPNSSVDSDGEVFEIESLSKGPKYILYLKGINNRDVIEKMLPFSIQISRENLAEPVNKDEFYLIDFIGMEVFEHQKGNKVGHILSSYSNGPQEIFVIKSDDGELIDIPYVKTYFKKIDWKSKRIEVVLPQYI